jgi:predicted RNase H-like HicB family nuclease
MLLRDYPILVFWNEGAFVAIAPDLPGCSAVGDSEGEAIEELHTAMGLWLDAARTMGSPIPAPSLPETFIARVAA